MGAVASQITSVTIVYSTVYSDTDQRKHLIVESEDIYKYLIYELKVCATSDFM